MVNRSIERRPKSITLSDVAKTAAVSTSTVSNVINHARYIRAETRERVEKAIKDLGYRPNKFAQIPLQSRTKTIGMIVPDNANPFFSELIRGVEDILANASYFVSFGNSENNSTKEQYYLHGFIERQVDGLIIAIASQTENKELIALSDEMPIVLVDRLIPGWTGDCVVQDNEMGMQLAVNHLVSLGHKMIAFINGDSSLSTAKERRAGFEASVQSFGLSPTSISEGIFSVDSGYMQTVSLLHNSQRPTAICAANDLLAIGAMRALFEADIKIPDDISVVGYDDINFASFIHPSLTTISQPVRSIGMESAQLILKRLSNPHGISQRINMTPKIIIRHSSTKPRGT
jgi:LacI family transcriptional regulator